jgi:hypothetical protein
MHILPFSGHTGTEKGGEPRHEGRNLHSLPPSRTAWPAYHGLRDLFFLRKKAGKKRRAASAPPQAAQAVPASRIKMGLAFFRLPRYNKRSTKERGGRMRK